MLPSLLLSGRRWLSGTSNDPACDDECDNDGRSMAPCVNPKYQMRNDLDVLYPLEFAADGSILPLRPLPSFTLDLP